jgi:hypothetical protein
LFLLAGIGLTFLALVAYGIVRGPAGSPPPVDVSVELAVAAANVPDGAIVTPEMVKRVRVTPTYVQQLRAGGRTLLVDQQPIGRVPRVPVPAETAFFEEDLLPLLLIEEGKSAANIEVEGKDTMVRVGDVVDLACTLPEGPGGSATLAVGARVVARFYRVTPGEATPSPPATRTVTLEVSPYRFALIELARKKKAAFSLTVHDPSPLEVGKLAADEPPADRVTDADLEALFAKGRP